MGVGADGCIDVFNSHGETHCVVDVFGYFTDGGGDRFVPLAAGAAVRHPGRHGRAAGQDLERRPDRHPGRRPRRRAGVRRHGGRDEPHRRPSRRVRGFVRVTADGGCGSRHVERQLLRRRHRPEPRDLQARHGGKVTINGRGDGPHVLGDVFGYFVSTATASGDATEAGARHPVRHGAPAGRVGPSRRLDARLAGRAGSDERDRGRHERRGDGGGGPSFVSVWPAGEAIRARRTSTWCRVATIANLVICRLGEGRRCHDREPAR